MAGILAYVASTYEHDLANSPASDFIELMMVAGDDPSIEFASELNGKAVSQRRLARCFERCDALPEARADVAPGADAGGAECAHRGVRGAGVGTFEEVVVDFAEIERVRDAPLRRIQK